ncbi:MAG TPA: hypothetical protein VMF03_15405 [Steroidobacteraceae bacterium]|nr:hypothetical protein [Steroidobacteraceae bacterium]
MNPRTPLTAVAALLAAGLLGLAGCASISAHLPWRHKTPPAPEVATALTVASPDGAAIAWPQFWQRNDVVLDMTAVSGTGSAVVSPRAGLAWPMRVALRVAPGTVGSVEVRGAQRWVVPVPAAGAPVELELPPGVYRATTQQLTVSWGPATAVNLP